MKQHRDPESYFSENEFEPSWFCVPASKCVVGDGLDLHPQKTLFNTVLAKPRVVYMSILWGYGKNNFIGYTIY
eukprot:CCRYP_012398-RA/>CCRYP_012398-RA protein AED:0.39 eAED:0.39 QI:0/0/0/1/0/0/2/0/72